MVVTGMLVDDIALEVAGARGKVPTSVLYLLQFYYVRPAGSLVG